MTELFTDLDPEFKDHTKKWFDYVTTYYRNEQIAEMLFYYPALICRTEEEREFADVYFNARLAQLREANL